MPNPKYQRTQHERKEQILAIIAQLSELGLNSRDFPELKGLYDDMRLFIQDGCASSGSYDLQSSIGGRRKRVLVTFTNHSLKECMCVVKDLGVWEIKN